MADRQRAAVVVGDPAGPVVQVIAAPPVVGLPRLHRVLDHDLARGLRRPHGDRDEPLRPGLRVHPQQVAALRPVVGRDGEGRIPARLHRVGRLDHGRLALLVPGHGARPPYPAGQVAAVPAHPERADRERAPGRRGIQRDRLTGQHAGLSRVAHHRAGPAHVLDVPVRVAGQRVFRCRPAPGGSRPGAALRCAGRPAGLAARGHRRNGGRTGGHPDEGPP